MRYTCLLHTVFTGTMIAGTMSKCVNKNAQVYGTYFGWMRLLPMKLKSDSHEKFPLVFKRVGVPPETIMDNYKEKSSSEFCKKPRETN